MILKVIELRLRFIVLMAATGLVFASWDTLVNQVEKWGRPKEGRHPSSSSPAGVESFCPMHPSVVSEQSGQCPICGMTLARRSAPGSESAPRRPVSGPARTWADCPGGHPDRCREFRSCDRSADHGRTRRL